jgi:hypothetical protein
MLALLDRLGLSNYHQSATHEDSLFSEIEHIHHILLDHDNMIIHDEHGLPI